MKTQFYGASSVDGFIADENHSLDWLFQFGDAPEESSYGEFIRDVGAIAMGSVTYEWVYRALMAEANDAARVWPYAQTSWVFSTRELPLFPGADLRFARGDVRPVHAEMAEAAGGKNIWVVGGGDLVGQFHDQGLLDELIIQVAPVILGAGAPLLPRRIAIPPLKLQSVQTFGDTFVELRYEVPKTAGSPTDTSPSSSTTP